MAVRRRTLGPRHQERERQDGAGEGKEGRRGSSESEMIKGDETVLSTTR